MSFALLVLELLAVAPRTGAEVVWRGSGDSLPMVAESSVPPTVSRSIAQAIGNEQSGSERLLNLVDLLATVGPLRDADLVEALTD